MVDFGDTMILRDPSKSISLHFSRIFYKWILNGIGQDGCFVSGENFHQILDFAFKAFSKSDQMSDITARLQEGGQQNRPRWLHYAWWKFSPDALFCIQSILQKCWKLLFNVSFCGWVSSQSDQPAALHSLKCLPVLFVEIEKMFDFYTIVYAILNIIDNCDVFFYSPPTLFSAFLANIRIGIKS